MLADLATTTLAALTPAEQLVVYREKCGLTLDETPGYVCTFIVDHTGSEFLARSSDALIVKPLLILTIVVVAVIVRAVLRRAISRFVARTVEGGPTLSRGIRRVGAGSFIDDAGISDARRRQRTETLGSVLRSIASIVVFSVGAVQALAVVGVNLGPIVASAGVVGVALGFGAQNLVRDFLSGIFMIIEDQYGVGDVIDVGEAVGSVEAVGLRVTRLRDVEGGVWYVRNGEILRVGNKSQGWSRAIVDVDVAYDTDLDLATTTIRSAADGLRADPAFSDLIVEAPEVWGVERLGADGVTIRLVVKTVPLQQWAVARALRRQVKDALDANGIEIPFPQRTLWVRDGKDPLPIGGRVPDEVPDPK